MGWEVRSGVARNATEVNRFAAPEVDGDRGGDAADAQDGNTPRGVPIGVCLLDATQFY